MKALILIGYMCVGKTTIGREVARRTGRRFYDLDWYIEERFHKRIPQIFADDGEERFRDMERRMLHEVAEFEDVVISCGGGTPCFFDNADYMNAVAETVYLKATPETILAHLKLAKGRRPLLEGKTPDELAAYVAAQLAEREPFYACARHTVPVEVLRDTTKVAEVASAVVAAERGGFFE
ncbi:MAG: shikimate kinase [Bacteroidaceae bacterium]|nr:shikimate kinase [Bacteroidaceae bacterium]